MRENGLPKSIYAIPLTIWQEAEAPVVAIASGHKALTWSALLLAGQMLVGCEIFSEDTAPDPVMPATPVAASLPPDLEAALCSDQPEAASPLLFGLANEDTSRFLRAIALERSGILQLAQAIYADLAKGQSGQPVRVVCGDIVLADGRIGAEATLGLVRVSALMAEAAADAAEQRKMQEASSPVPGTEKTIPSRPEPLPAAPRRETATPALPSAEASPVTAPASANMSGAWFAHMSSYRSAESAATGRDALAARFPAIGSLIEIWALEQDGALWRVGVTTVDSEEADQLCASVTAAGQYCDVLDRIGIEIPNS